MRRSVGRIAMPLAAALLVFAAPASASVDFVSLWGVGAQPSDVAVDNAGAVYVTAGDQVLKYDASGAPVTSWGTFGTGARQFSITRGIATDGSGHVYVVDVGNHRIQKFAADGTFLLMWGWGVADGTSATLQTCTSSCHAGIAGTGPGQFSDAVAMATDASGNVYVTDITAARVQKFDPSGALLASWGLSGAFAITVAPSGGVYVSSSWDVKQYTAAGAFVGTWSAGGGVNGLAADAAGRLWASVDDKVERFDAAGALQVSLGSSAGSASGQFNAPEGVAVAPSGDLYVADFQNFRIQRFGVTAPVAPSITATAPAATGHDNAPVLSGSAPAGTTVKVYAGSDCSGAAVASGSAANFAAPGFTMAVADNSSTTWRATATDAVGDVSACSGSYTYVEDSVAPAKAVLTGSAPGSPANDNAPLIKGSAEAGATVRLYSSSDCLGASLASGAAGTFSGAGIAIAIADDDTMTLFASVVDAAGNVSACSNGQVYQEDSTAPAPSIDGGPSGLTRVSQPSFDFLAGDAVSAACSVDTGTPDFVPCTGGNRHVVTTPLADGSYTFRLRATDAAGNSATVTRSFTVDTRPPSVTIAAPLDGAVFAVGQVVAASFACGEDAVTCDGSTASGGLLDTSQPGTHEFTAGATDAIGNGAAQTVTYTVIGDAIVPIAPSFPAVAVTIAGPASTRAKGSGIRFDPGLMASCPVGLDACSFAERATAKVGTRRVAIGKATFRTGAGAGRRLAFRLSASGAKLLRGRGRLRVTVIVVGRVSASAPLVKRRTVTIKAPRRH